MKAPSLVRALPPGPLDLIGDVHGELQTLLALLRELGYRDGSHSEGRRLVFVGDLVDRGPDSPGVVELVSELVARDRASCVLGNHELNLLRLDRKSGAGWFWGQGEEDDGATYVMRQRTLASESERATCLAFLATLPLALEREDVRVVHACWDERAIAGANEARDVVEFFDQEFARLEREADEGGLRRRMELELDQIHARGLDRKVRGSGPFPFFPALAEWESLDQRNAVKLLTSGPELPVGPKRTFYAHKKWRLNERYPWWRSYQGKPVVCGHYWRDPNRPGGMGTQPRDASAQATGTQITRMA